MNAKILKILLIISGLFLFSGCSQKETVYIDRPVEVKVPVKCIAPKVECNFNQATDTEVIQSLLICIKDLKKSNEVCNK